MDDDIRAITADELGDVLQPFLWLAALAFSAGFWGFLALAPMLRL
jgi:hypothetical protein